MIICNAVIMFGAVRFTRIPFLRTTMFVLALLDSESKVGKHLRFGNQITSFGIPSLLFSQWVGSRIYRYGRSHIFLDIFFAFLAVGWVQKITCRFWTR